MSKSLVAASRAVHAGLARALFTALVVALPASVLADDGGVLAGRWATSYEVPITWRLNAGVEGGRGTLWVGGVIERTALGAGRYADVLHVCGRRAPVTKTLGLYGGERYGSALDVSEVPFAALPRAHATLHRDEASGHFVTDPLVIDYGLTDAASSFPRGAAEATHRATARADDGGRGVRLLPRTDDGLRLPPVNARRTRRAQALDAVLRDVLQADGQIIGDDALSGEVTVVDAFGQPGLLAQLVGCVIDGGGACTRGELGLMNAFAPTFRAEAGTVHMVRIDDDAGCAEALAVLLP